MIAALTGSGLATAAGLNAYIPFMLVALLARFTDVIVLPSSYTWVESNTALTVGAILLCVEFVLDKIPVVDHLNDVVATAIRPTMGGLIFSATTSARNLDNSTWMRHNPWVAIILGVLLAGVTHATKATARPVVNVSTVGTGAPIVSTLEDIASLGLSLVAVFAPVLVIFALILLAGMIFIVGRWAVRRRRRRTQNIEARPGLGGAATEGGWTP